MPRASRYLLEKFDAPSAVIGHDRRSKSDLFAKVAAGVFVANGIKMYLWSELMPVPMVSLATRYFRASTGTMITASHNSSKYNGYKVMDGSVLTAFIDRGKEESLLFEEEINRDVAIVYSPLNGNGLKPVTRILSESSLTNITVVEEQQNPDGKFPTCLYPNPEIREAMELGLQYCG